MSLKLITSLVSSLLRRTPHERSEKEPPDLSTDNSTLHTSPSQPSSIPSISFSSTVTIQGMFSKKTDDRQDTLSLSTAANGPESLHHWHNQPSAFDAKSSSTVHDYELLETLGTGTFGRVYLAREKKDKSYYAIKILKKADIVKLKQVEHINSERQVLSQLNFPFIVKLYCTFQNEQNLYMVQEYVLGGELFRHLRNAGRFTSEMTRFYTAEIVLALDYLHSKNMVYRDLKPENLLLDRTGHIKITDFGFAKRLQDRTWTLCGTPEYLAPEIIQSKGHGKAVDWWSLGILIFEMLAGYPPFYDDNHFGIYERILSGKVQYPNYMDSTAKDLIKKLLVIDRTRRLGNLKCGAEDVKRHKWLRNTDWLGLLNKTVRAPLIPAHSSDYDTSNFEKYPEEPPAEASHGDPYRSLFADF
ncbi:kinase-like domain-containing protein [Radiomyces spectabilis]|uniref:kinase-like domain-containing protein n=1 Tax=Radiomyces spectabilis TaxID=64574 RepID=UPI00221E5B65|nr:kinase-like domain-containing protein [Radiomyces spectabilis]KAI8388321.1 kinase-like domain-containing protein [Radiomyces spectabilis]